MHPTSLCGRSQLWVVLWLTAASGSLLWHRQGDWAGSTCKHRPCGTPLAPGAQCCHPTEPSQQRGWRNSCSREAGACCEWRCWACRPVGRTAWSSWKSVCSMLWVLEHIFHSKPGTGYCAKPPITKYPHMRQVTETAVTTIGGTASYLLRDLLV